MRTKKRKVNKIFKVVDSVIYPCDILFTVGTTKDEVISYLKDNCNYPLDAEETEKFNLSGNKKGYTIQLKNRAIVLWVENDSLPIIAHKVYHVVEFTMEFIKTPMNEATSEPCAYFTEYLFRQIISVLKA